MQTTLFYVDNVPIKHTFRSKYLKWKYENNYRKADHLSDIRCKNCKHLFANIYNTTSGKYYKCELLGRSSSAATDIRLSCVCDLFETDIKEEKC